MEDEIYSNAPTLLPSSWLETKVPRNHAESVTINSLPFGSKIRSYDTTLVLPVSMTRHRAAILPMGGIKILQNQKQLFPAQNPTEKL